MRSSPFFVEIHHRRCDLRCFLVVQVVGFLSVFISNPPRISLVLITNFLTSLSARYTLLMLASTIVSIRQWSPLCGCENEKTDGEGGESAHYIRLRRKEVKCIAWGRKTTELSVLQWHCPSSSKAVDTEKGG